MKSISKEIFDLVDSGKRIQLMNEPTPYQRYMELCKLNGQVPYPEDNNNWIEHYVILREDIAYSLNVTIPSSYKVFFDGLVLVIDSFKNYVKQFIDEDNNIYELLQELTSKVEGLIDSRKEGFVLEAENGEYDNLLEPVKDSDFIDKLVYEPQRVVYQDYFNHIDDDTIAHGVVFNGEIEIEIPKSYFDSLERDLLDLIENDAIRSSIVVRDNGDSYLFYDTFYLQIQLQK
ncbi:MAG: hypothetical protein XD93_0861 [candidate division WS6 bacterium 34_10]|uniref:Uncharacterized protein n=1 Tax=candidate division WS6 bacterium 34_10 TaxID=1641389 RepID=A0A124FX04_9BACT|nr:MAG: hypothetical protein XD93_0861 [candidate division WS6 bacterium 34_10]